MSKPVVRPIYQLQPFAKIKEATSARAARFTVEVWMEDGRLWFQFQLAGKERLENLLLLPLQPLSERRRVDGLWQHTCFELFLALRGRDSYLEFNLSPSGDWNLYEFQCYRVGMRKVPLTSAPEITIDQSAEQLIIRGGLEGLPLERPALPRQSQSENLTIEVSATAVLEYTGRVHEYWALKHHDAKPDFHQRHTFIAILQI